MANQRFIRTSILLTSLLAAVSLTACGDDNDDNSSATSSSSSTSSTSSSKSSSSASTSSTSSSTSSTSSSTSSTSSSTSSTAGHTSVTATTWSETFDAADIDALVKADYAAWPSNSAVPLYIKVGNSVTAGGGALTLANGRLLIGAASSTASTATEAPDGIFNMSGKTCTLVVNTTAASGSAFQVFVNNSTTSAASTTSPLGAASRVWNQAPTVGANTITFALTAADYHSDKAFVQLRADSATSLTIDSIQMTCK
ncbi:hypothetical protein ACDA63_17010 [Uliginosibacterium sp. sgz301328]|uniref:hypothetical protein n=1 Tax=Uliginosibacterium sp. sgz301328 TaxID=3243764 RepID=UPI00359DA2D5